MGFNFFTLFVVLVLVTCCLNYVEAETATQSALTFPSKPRHLKGTNKDISEEERISIQGFSRLKSLLRRDTNKMKEAGLNEREARRTLNKLKTLLGLSNKGPTKLTPAKQKTLETFARDNPNKWAAMTYYLEYAYGIGFTLFLAGGALFFGSRPAGLGGPDSN